MRLPPTAQRASSTTWGAQLLGTLIGLGLIGLGLIGASAASADQPATDRQVRTAIADGIKFLRSTQRADGTWPDHGMFTDGTTGLVLTALLTAGVPRTDESVQRGLRVLSATRHQHTYVVALKAMALAAADPDAYREELQKCADDLVRWQKDDGTWTYGDPDRYPRNVHGDNSNTQFALLGLHEAARAGAKVPPAVWERSDRHFRQSMAESGAWGYLSRHGNRSGTMTAAAVASLHITGGTAHHSQERGFVDGAAPNCGKYLQDVHIASGLDWLGRNFSVVEPPGGSRDQLLYWFHAFERVGVLTGQRTFGGRDWFREGAERLLPMQRADGSWPAGHWNSSINSAFAVLFLVKGRLPVLVNKLRHAADWNNDHDDIRNLCVFASANNVFTEPVGWQVVDLDAPLERLLDAPLLYLNGHRFPEFSDAHAAKLRAFLERGGILLVEACCGRREFDAGFRKFLAERLPEYRIGKLDSAHPVYHSHYDFREDPPVLLGVDLACRTSIFYSPRDLSCLWHQANLRDPAMRDHTVRAFQLGANIAAYAAGREPLRDRLAEVTLPPVREDDATAPRGAVPLAQVRHAGDWRPCVRALPNLSALLRDKAGIDVTNRPEALNLGDRALFGHPILFLSGHHKFELTADEKRQLRQYLQRGGFLFAEACCGRAAFDESLRTAIAEIFPESEFPKSELGPTRPTLRQLPADHPIITGRDAKTGQAVGFDLSKIRYRPMARRETPNLMAPVLFGLELDGRLAVVYSPYSLACGLDGMNCSACRGVEPEDAKRLSMNIILQALTR